MSVLQTKASYRTVQNWKKYLVLGLIPLTPLLYVIFDHFILHRRGSSTPDLQFEVIFCTGRFLLAPLVVLYISKCWVESNKITSFISNLLIGLILYIVLHWSFSFTISKTFMSFYDPRNWNLFHVIKNESSLSNLLMYISSFGLLYIWIYYERYSDRTQQVSLLEGNLLNAKQLQHNVAEDKGPPNKPIESLSIKTGLKTTIVAIDQILYFQSNGPYVRVITNDKTHLISMPLYQLSAKLPVNFVRIHRSYVINSRHIKQTKSLLNGDYIIVLDNMAEIRASRTYRENIREFIVNT